MFYAVISIVRDDKPRYHDSLSCESEAAARMVARRLSDDKDKQVLLERVDRDGSTHVIGYTVHHLGLGYWFKAASTLPDFWFD